MRERVDGGRGVRNWMRGHRIAWAATACTVLLAALVVAGPAAFGATAPSSGKARPTVPNGFHAQSLSWISSTEGWMLGSTPCGRASCSTVLATADGGQTWSGRGQTPTWLRTLEAEGHSREEFRVREG